MGSGYQQGVPWLALTVTPTTTPAWGLFELTSSEKSWSWICKYGLKSPAGGIWGEHGPTGSPLTGLKRSRSHQTISEQVLGSGAMTSTGSARTRHSQSDHRAGRKDAKARSGAEWGSDTSS